MSRSSLYAILTVFVSLLSPELQASDVSSSDETKRHVKRQLSHYEHGNETRAADYRPVRPKLLAGYRNFFVAGLQTIANREVFVKVVPRTELTALWRVTRYFAENHPNNSHLNCLCLPIHLHEDPEVSNRDVLIYPKLEGLHFEHLLNSYEEGALEEKAFLKFIAGFAVTLAKLHQLGGLGLENLTLRTRCIHGDLHGRNVMFIPRVGIKFIDLETMASSIEQATDIREEFKSMFWEIFPEELPYGLGTALFPKPKFLVTFFKYYSMHCGLDPKMVNPILVHIILEYLHTLVFADDNKLKEEQMPIIMADWENYLKRSLPSA